MFVPCYFLFVSTLPVFESTRPGWSDFGSLYDWRIVVGRLHIHTLGNSFLKSSKQIQNRPLVSSGCQLRTRFTLTNPVPVTHSIIRWSKMRNINYNTRRRDTHKIYNIKSLWINFWRDGECLQRYLCEHTSGCNSHISDWLDQSPSHSELPHGLRISINRNSPTVFTFAAVQYRRMR